MPQKCCIIPGFGKDPWTFSKPHTFFLQSKTSVSLPSLHRIQQNLFCFVFRAIHIGGLLVYQLRKVEPKSSPVYGKWEAQEFLLCDTCSSSCFSSQIAPKEPWTQKSDCRGSVAVWKGSSHPKAASRTWCEVLPWAHSTIRFAFIILIFNQIYCTTFHKSSVFPLNFGQSRHVIHCSRRS